MKDKRQINPSTHKTNTLLRRYRRQEAGFTLIEWMTSMMTLGIGIVALISMQSTSLRTHMATRDVQTAGSLADQFLEMLQVDALRWRGQLSIANLRYLNPGKYAISNSVIDNWHPYSAYPVNFQMRYNTHSSQGSGAKYCIFFSYRWAGAPAGVSSFQEDVIEANVLVLTPRNPQGLPKDAASGECTSVRDRFWQCDTNLLKDSSCSARDRFLLFRQLQRAGFIRRNISDLGNWYDQKR